MDLKGYSDKVFKSIEEEYRAFLTQLGVVPRLFIPIAAYHGENIATKSAKMPWYNGPTVLEALDQFEVAPPEKNSARWPRRATTSHSNRRSSPSKPKARCCSASCPS